MPSLRFTQCALMLVLAFGSACMGTKHIDEGPITVLRNGDRVAEPTRARDAAAADALDSRLAGQNTRDSLAAIAYAGCSQSVCAALGRGELALGMTEAQLFVATHTSALAWGSRASGNVEVFTPRNRDAMPADAIAPVELVQLANGVVASITYREPQGLRTVNAAGGVSATANRIRAEALSREGDALAAAGDFTGALDRYDRASIVDRSDAELQYKMATSLEKLLRPMEAELRYKLFLHQLELEKIDAIGDANAKLADAIAQAKERIIVLDRRGS